eukprot:snap_masked-scaffold_21-processed-gene-5.55-mRNA-1 protein AED:1.00 eAED:1.00 QI:0/0/0/0/1/1/2/0/69
MLESKGLIAGLIAVTPTVEETKEVRKLLFKVIVGKSLDIILWAVQHMNLHGLLLIFVKKVGFKFYAIRG